MRTWNAAVVGVALLGLLAACGEPTTAPTDPEPEPEPETTEIQVPANASISIAVTPEGDARIEVTIPEGHPGAGTYTSTSEYLIQAARDGRDNLGKPGHAMSLKLLESGEIHSISVEATLLD